MMRSAPLAAVAALALAGPAAAQGARVADRYGPPRAPAAADDLAAREGPTRAVYAADADPAPALRLTSAAGAPSRMLTWPGKTEAAVAAMPAPAYREPEPQPRPEPRWTPPPAPREAAPPQAALPTSLYDRPARAEPLLRPRQDAQRPAQAARESAAVEPLRRAPAPARYPSMREAEPAPTSYAAAPRPATAPRAPAAAVAEYPALRREAAPVRAPEPQAPPPQRAAAAPAYPPQAAPAPQPALRAAAAAAPSGPLTPAQMAAAIPPPSHLAGHGARFYSLHREYGMTPDAIPTPPKGEHYVLIGPPDDPAATGKEDADDPPAKPRTKPAKAKTAA